MGENENITPRKPSGWTGNRTETDQKYLAFALLIEQGISITKASEMMGYKPNYGYHLAKKVRDRRETLSLVSESRVRKAHRVVDKILAGKPFGSIETIKDSTALRAVEIVLDRAEPKVQDQQPPGISFTTINLNLAKPDHPDAIDISDYPPKEENGAGAPGGNGSKTVGNLKCPQ